MTVMTLNHRNALTL